MMTSIADNFAGYPNRKLILFPTGQLRTQFYNELGKHSKTFFLSAKNASLEYDPKIEYRKRSDGVKYEVPDKVRAYFSKEGYSGVELESGISFERYIQNMNYISADVKDGDNPMYDRRQPKGVTLMLTFREFQLLLDDKDPAQLRLVKHFLGQGKYLTLDDATVLVDEAHLLYLEKWKSVREFLENSQQKMYSMYLFSATPGDYIRYKWLLWTDKIGDCKAPSFKRNCISRYSDMHEKLYNREDVWYKHVSPSKILLNRADSFGSFPKGDPMEKWIIFNHIRVMLSRTFFENNLPEQYKDVDKWYDTFLNIPEPLTDRYLVSNPLHEIFPIGSALLSDVLIRYECRVAILKHLSSSDVNPKKNSEWEWKTN